MRTHCLYDMLTIVYVRGTLEGRTLGNTVFCGENTNKSAANIAKDVELCQYRLTRAYYGNDRGISRPEFLAVHFSHHIYFPAPPSNK